MGTSTSRFAASLAIFYLSAPAAGFEVINGVRFDSGSPEQLYSSGLALKINVQNRNGPDTLYAGNLSVTLSVVGKPQVPVDEIHVELGLPHSAGSSFWAKREDPVRGLGGYTFAIGACDIHRAEVHVHFAFPDTYKNEKFFYVVPLSRFVALQAKRDRDISEFLASVEGICKEHGIDVSKKEDCGCRAAED